MSERQSVSSGSPYEPRIGFSRAVRVGPRVLVSGTAPIWPDGSCDPDPEAQARRCLEIIAAALREAGAGLEHVVRTRLFLTSARDWEAVGRAHGAAFAGVRPAATMVVVAGLLDPRWKVEIEAEAFAPPSPGPRALAEPAPVDHGAPFDWGRASRDYALYRPGYPESFWRRAAALGIGLKGQRALDLGTGTGNLAVELARRGCEVTGIDLAPRQIEEARKRADEEKLRIDFRVAPAESTGLPNRAFDVILASQCWIYFDLPRVIPEVKRLLAPGGRLVTCHLIWLPRLDPIQRETERLVLKHNPGWTGADEPSEVPPIPAWAVPDFRVTAMFFYDEALPFTRETWRGRLRACRGIGAALEPERVRAFDAELDELLSRIAGEDFTVLHRIEAHVFEPLTS